METTDDTTKICPYLRSDGYSICDGAFEINCIYLGDFFQGKYLCGKVVLDLLDRQKVDLMSKLRKGVEK